MKRLHHLLQVSLLRKFRIGLLVILFTLAGNSARSQCSTAFVYQPDSSGYTIQFFDSSFTGNPVSWLWSFGDSSTSNLQYPAHTYSSPGYYNVCLDVAFASGCTATFCDTVYVGPALPGCQAYFTAYNSSGTTVNFTNQSSSSTGAFTSSWDFGDGTFSGQSNPLHQYIQGGTYNVCLTITSSGGACTDTYCSVVSVQSGGACMAGFDYSSTGLNTFAFTDSSYTSSGTITSWYWTFGDSTISTFQNPNHTFPGPGTYYVCLTIATSGGCTAQSCTYVVVSGPSCTPSFGAYRDSTTGLTVQFVDYSPANITGWSWDFGDGSGSAQQNPVHVYAQTGTYTVCLTVTDSVNLCTGTTCQQVSATNACAPYFGAYPDSLNPSNLNMNFWIQSPCGQPTTVFWDFGDGTGDSSGVMYPNHTYADTGTYNVCVCVVIGPDTFCNCQPVMVYRLSNGVGDNVSAVTGLTSSPNPFRESAQFELELNASATLNLRVVDLLGTTVKEVYAGRETAGRHSYTFVGDGLAYGIYILRLEVNGSVVTRRICFAP